MTVKCCRLCLAVEVKVFKLENTAARNFIQNVLQENGFKQELCKSHHICYVCKALLDKSHNFIQRIVSAQQILNNIMKVNKKITLTTLKEIDRQQIDICSSLITHKIKNIDIFPTDDDKKWLVEGENIDLMVDSVKQDVDFDTIEANSPVDDLYTNDTFETIIKVEPHELKNATAVETTNKKNSNTDENYPTFSTKEQKHIKRKKRIHTDLEISNVTDEMPVKKKCPIKWEPSKFISSLSNVGDKSERRKKQYAFKGCGDYSDFDNSDDDKAYQPESTGESSDSNYDRYDGTGQKIKQPIREYPRKCDHCEYEVPKANDHYKHYLIVHPNKQYPYPTVKGTYVCQYCGKISKRKSLHNYHVQTHSTKKKFKCNKCHKKFYNVVHLRRHKRSTHTKKFLECDYCSKKFKRREDITRHLRIHTGQKPYKCHICGVGFAHRGNVGVHIRSNHKQLKDEGKPLKIGIKKKSNSLRKPTKSQRKRERKDSSDDSTINLLQLKERKNKKQ